MRSSRVITTQRCAPASLSQTTSCVACGNSSSCTRMSSPAARRASGTFFRPSDRSMKNTRDSGGFRRLELAADRFFDVERVLAIIFGKISDRLARLVPVRDDRGRRCRHLQNRPAELDARIHRDNSGLRDFLSGAPPTARERIKPRDESILVPLYALEVQPDQIAHRELAVSGCIDHILDARGFNEQMLAVREHLVVNQGMLSPEVLP